MTLYIEPAAIDTDKPCFLYENIFDQGTVTVSHETADGAGLNAIEDTTFDFWTPSSVPANIAVDCGVPVPVDCFAIVSHTAGSEGSTIAIQSSVNGSDWTSRSTVTPTDDSSIFAIFPQVTARYWRVLVTDEVCSIGIIKAGARLIMPCGPLSGHVGINHAKRVELLTNMSQKGQFLGTRVRRVGAETSINLGLVDRDFVDTDMVAFEAHFDDGQTFIYAGGPDDYPLDYGYCWRDGGELRPTYDEGGEMMNIQLNVSVYVEQ
jgi:hypothetical protein